MTETVRKIRLHTPPANKTISAISQATALAGGETPLPEKTAWNVISGFLKRRDLQNLSDEELGRRLARSEKRVGWNKHLGDVVVHALVLGMAAVMVGLLVMGVAHQAVALWSLASGVGIFFGTGYSYRAVVRSAMRERDAVTEVLEPRIQAKQAAAEENRVTLEKKAAEAFKRAIDSGLPLEQNIIVKGPLKFKKPAADSRPGTGGIFKMFDP